MQKNSDKYDIHSCVCQKKSVPLQAERLKLRNVESMEKEITLHQAKMNLLQVMDSIQTVDEVQAIRALLANYYAQKVNEEMDRLWENGTINEQTIEEWGNEHMRTPYRYAK